MHLAIPSRLEEDLSRAKAARRSCVGPCVAIVAQSDAEENFSGFGSEQVDTVGSQRSPPALCPLHLHPETPTEGPRRTQSQKALEGLS